MPEPKQHLRNLYRTDPDIKSRSGYLRLDMNEGSPGLPEDFVKEVFAGVDAELISTYPEYKKLNEKIAKHNDVQPENICISNGSDAAIKYIFDAYISPGDKVLLTDPTFAMYPVYCRMFAAEPVMVTYPSDMSFPVDDFSGRISSEIRMAVIVNPNNPAGSAIKEEELLELIEKAARNDVLMVLDEAYFYFYPRTFIKKVGESANLIVLRTFSKLLGMASLRLGYAAACQETIEILRKVKPTYDVNGISVLLAEALLDNPEVIETLIESANKGKRYLIERLSSEGIEHREGEANFVLIRCSGRVKEVVDRLADMRILVTGGFKQPFLEDFIRVTTGDEAAMKKFWVPFIGILKEYGL